MNESAEVSLDLELRSRPNISSAEVFSNRGFLTENDFATIQNADDLVPWRSIRFDLKKF